MIYIAALIKELSQVGVKLSKNGDEIVLDGPASVLTDNLIEEVRAHKSDILATFGEWDLRTGRRSLMSVPASPSSMVRSRA